MNILSGFNTIDKPIELPPGFRFHPTDEELITHYLSPKVVDTSFITKAIGEVDLNKVEPWDLPWKAKMGEKEWYFFCVRDRKYPTGLRTNRATEAGYWKATGKDKEIYRARILVGMKKTLVFYRGRAPKGEKTNWVMHEYRIEGKNSLHNFPKSTKNEWVICRIFKKSTGGKKVHISGLVNIRNYGPDSKSTDLPPLMDLSSDENRTRNTTGEGSHVTCFSNLTEDPRDKFVDEFTSKNSDFSQFQLISPKLSNPNSFFYSQSTGNLHYADSVVMQNTKTEDMSMNHHELGFKPNYEDQEFTIMSNGPVDLDCLWNY
ncbi:hypothetical protein ACJIZ3_002075 [Penstemon smallii]|uniref:NAC domain-containing protein n=1 Tax=Penstemon smallii TaxID=265156 RepID=A0ABD3U8M8_9LAMI